MPIQLAVGVIQRVVEQEEPVAVQRQRLRQRDMALAAPRGEEAVPYAPGLFQRPQLPRGQGVHAPGQDLRGGVGAKPRLIARQERRGQAG